MSISMNCRTGRKLPTNANGKAMAFRLFACHSAPIRTFWVTTLSFFLCFFVWFGNTNLESWIADDIVLTPTHISISKSVLTVSTIISRIIIGDLCDKIGARYCYILILFISMIPVFILALITTPTQYILCNLFIGVIGSSFVITQYHTTQFFSDRLIGLANGTSAGWGNFGGGVAAIFMPYLATTYAISWRYLTVSSGVLLIIPIALYYFTTKDTPKGNLSDTGSIWTSANILNTTALRDTTRDYRTWVFFIIYAACFGVEITMLSFMKDYMYEQFHSSHVTSGFYVLMFSSLNLFARSVGGYATDMLYRKYGIQGRVYTLFLVLLAESVFLMLFSFGKDIDIIYSVVIMLFFSFYVQCAEGITYAIVPFLGYNISGKIGALYGIVGAGGNFGSFISSITLFWNLKYHHAFLVLSVFVFITAFLTLTIRFSTEEIRKADELLNSFLKKYNRKIHGKRRSRSDKKEVPKPPRPSKGVAIEFHIHPEVTKKEDTAVVVTHAKLNLVDSLKKLTQKASTSLSLGGKPKSDKDQEQQYSDPLIEHDHESDDLPPLQTGDDPDIYAQRLKQIFEARVSEETPL